MKKDALYEANFSRGPILTTNVTNAGSAEKARNPFNKRGWI